MFFSRGSLGSVEFAFTDRKGGHSDGNFASLNLGSSTTRVDTGDVLDDPLVVERNQAILAVAFDVSRVITMTQVHGAGVVYVDSPMVEAPIADALITDCPGLGLLVRAADCTPVLLADPIARIIGVVHAGRDGMVKGVALAAVRAMRDRGATRIQAWVGPRACGSCYEVPEAMAEEICGLIPQARSTTSWGTPSLDVGKGVIAQLRSEDVEVTDLGEGVCTIEDEQFFSYRRQGRASGRQGGIAVLRPVAHRA